MSRLLKNGSMLLFAFLFITMSMMVMNLDARKIRLPNGSYACICQLNWNPVCGSDGVTYDNLCSFECTRDKFVERGEPAITLANEYAAC